MKRLSMLSLVLLLGGVPLTAAAIDFGPEQPLIASDQGVPALPTTEPHAASLPPLAKPDGGGASDTPATPPVIAHAPAAATRATDRVHSASKPELPPTQPSWQSLLPGSIQ